MILIVMGVSGSGKSTVGRLVAAQLGWEFRDGDDFHPATNVAKMQAGTPLTDDDRRPWLLAIQEFMRTTQGAGRNAVVACSALKEIHRQLLLKGEPWVRFIHLQGSRELIAGRMAERRGHFMPPTLLDSQFATLESPADALVVNIAPAPTEIAREIIERLGFSAPR